MKTGVDWNTAVKQENSKDRSLISAKVNAAWKTAAYDNSWAYPTDGILSYYMDPRNFLTENYIFQFELLSYNPTYHTEAAVQDILKNTFMSGAIPDDEQGRSYSQAFYSIAQNLVVSPFHLASRVRQEQGDGKSALISGSYPGYTNLYNYFNIGATGKGNTQIIENGLSKAKVYGWTTRYLSLAGGADIISKNYIRKGQDTLYLQKFNVNKTSASGLYNHQYMQNIAAPSSESISVKNAYTSAGSINNPFVFRIPVYDSMPATPCAQPANLKSMTLNTNKLTLKTDETAVLTASIDGKAADSSSVSFSSSNTKIAAVAADGTVTAVSGGTAEITCTASGSTTASCTITVQKNTPSYTVPALPSVTYDPKQTLQAIALPAGWTWENPSIIPSVENSGYPAVYTPADTNKYTTVKQILTLTVTKGIPAYTVPSGLQTFTGNTLASLKLPAGFTWENPSTTLTKAGTFSHPASYNPDPTNYQTVTGISVSVTVTEKATVCTTHNYIAEITKQATESETGIRTYTCDKCGDTYTEEIAKLPAAHKHSYSSSVAKQPTCTEKGVKSYVCSCGDTYSEDIAALGHDMTNGTCRRCGYTQQAANTSNNSSDKENNSANSNDSNNVNNDDNSSNNNNEGDDNNAEQSEQNDNDTNNNNNDDNDTNNDNNDDSNTNNDNNADNENTGSNPNNESTGNNPNNESTGSNPNNENTGSNPNHGTAGNANSNTTNAPAANTKAPSNNKATTDSQFNNNITIDMQKNSVLYEETISSLRGQDVDVTLDMGNHIIWTINGKNIVADEANGIDMSVKTDTKNIPETIREQASQFNETNSLIELDLSHDGPFDFRPILTIHTDSAYSGYNAALFYYNPDTDRLEYIDETTVTETGDIMFTFSHASDYIIIISSSSLSNISVITNDGVKYITESTDTQLAEPTEADAIAANAAPAQNDPTQESGFRPTLLLIIILIVLVLIIIGCTVFLIFRSKDEDEEDEPIEENDADEESGIEYLEEDNSGKKVFEEDPFDEYSEDDDYYEPPQQI